MIPAIGEHHRGRLGFSNSKIYFLHTFYYYAKSYPDFLLMTKKEDLLVFRRGRQRRCTVR